MHRTTAVRVNQNARYDSSGGINWDAQNTNCPWVELGKVKTKLGTRHMIDHLIFLELA